MEHVGLAQIVPSVPLWEQPDGKNRLNSRYVKKSTVKDCTSSWVVVVVGRSMHDPKGLFASPITSWHSGAHLRVVARHEAWARRVYDQIQ